MTTPPVAAQDGGTIEDISSGNNKSDDENAFAPKVRVVAFQDKPDSPDCDPLLARYGLCVEEVEFAHISPAWSATEEPLYSDWALWRNYGRLYGQFWEDLAYRWFEDEDEIQQTFVPWGDVVLPTAPAQWDATARHDTRSRAFSLPDKRSWLDESGWSQPEGSYDKNHPAFFRQIRYHQPPSTSAPPDMVLLSGRFAYRLGFDGRLHDYDLMDADRKSSGPFFEQMYPYRRGMSANDEQLSPLMHFIYAEQNPPNEREVLQFRERSIEDVEAEVKKKNPKATGEELEVLIAERAARLNVADLRKVAEREFDDFYRLLGTQIAQFALAEYTSNHVRVLSALMAMQTPPGGLAIETGKTEDINIGSEGRTDSDETVSARVGRSAYTLQGGFELNYYNLPINLVKKYLAELMKLSRLEDKPYFTPDEVFYEEFNAILFDNLHDLLRPDTNKALLSMDSNAIEAWVATYSRPGTSKEIVSDQIHRTAMSLMMGKEPKDVRDLLETRILQDHVNQEIASTFNENKVLKPVELVTNGAKEWKNVLGMHGHRTQYIEQGLGGVDPTAVCSMEMSAEAAQNDEIFKAINLDVLVAASDGVENVNVLLWEARDQLPFMMLDNPTRTRPTVQRLVGLPGDRALYRIRWRIWSGWHLFWDAESLDDGLSRAVLRSGAVCEDTILTSPDLVPTLVRSAMLDGDFRPTMPAMWKDKRRLKKAQKAYEEATKADRAKSASTSGQAPPEPPPEEAAPENSEEIPEGVPEEGGEGISNEEAVYGADAGISEADQTREDVERGVDVAQADASYAGYELMLGVQGLQNFLDLRREDPFIEDTFKEPVNYLRQFTWTPLKALAAENEGLVVLVFDSTDEGRFRWMRDRLPRTPYARRQAKVRKGGFVRTSYWAQWVDGPVEEQAITMVSPDFRETESVASDTPTPRWGRIRTSDWTFSGGLGAFPYRQVNYKCSQGSAVNDLGTVEKCEGGDLSTHYNDGLSADFSALVTWWLMDDWRMAVEFGPEMRLDVTHGGYPWFHDNIENADGSVDPWREDFSTENLDQVRYAWTFMPQFGMIAGWRYAPDPRPMWRIFSARTPWGAESPDGTSLLRRSQYGLRTGITLGPGYNGLEAAAIGEVWAGSSIRRRRSPHASFTPYHPGMLMGPYFRYQYGFVTGLESDEDRYGELENSHTWIVGVRAQIRLKSGEATVPEGF